MFMLECEVQIRKKLRVVYSSCAWKLAAKMLTEKVLNLLNVHGPSVAFISEAML